MFENLSERLERSFKILKGEGKITEVNISEAMKDIRRALLDADVSYKIAKQFCDDVKKKAIGQNVVPGPIFSSDCFYEQGCDVTSSAKLMKLGVLCVEMESYALYLNAAAAGKNALALLTISDSLVTGEALPAEDRQNTFTKMMEIALEIA